MTSVSVDDLGNVNPFDADWYIEQYPDVAELGIDPLQHYLLIGSKIGRRPCPDATQSSADPERESVCVRPNAQPFRRFGVIEHHPLISIIIVSFNSGSDLRVLFPTIAKQTYRNFEVILIENGEEDTSALLDQHFDKCHYLKSDNVGFAEANNIGLRASKGELIALINPDTRLAFDTLQNLLDALRFDESAAVVVPKINFFERFVRLQLIADAEFSILRGDLVRGLAYKKIFVRTGTQEGELVRSDERGRIALDLPYEGERTIQLSITGAHDITRCEVRVGYSEKNYITRGDGLHDIRISLDDENCSSARYLVNNAGSSLRPDGSPYDRGFAQFDDGAFFSKSYVSALCGCAALIRRTAVLDRELFAGPFFAYYEDSELSHWLGEEGYRILYQPEAEVFHRHSESTEESSLAWKVLVGRSKRLYDILTGPASISLSSFAFDYPDDLSWPLREKLNQFDHQVRNSGTRRDLVKPRRRTACVYNTYFSSMGGGEKHALDVASILRDTHDVYLASESDFDISKLEKYFSVNLAGVRKLISTNIDSWFTSKFDVFVNSTFRSNLISASPESIYIVSFPHADIDARVVSNYRFFHNSPFTAEWAAQLWGKHDGETVLPILGEYKALGLDIRRDSKKKDILAVGRLTYDGHCKNHHLVLDAYKMMVDARPDLAKWRLRILGSCDYGRGSAVQYLSDLRQAATGYNVEVLPNVDRDILDAAYTDAAIYVHAAGLSVPRARPELHEHFGITTFEAIAHGCLPVVYHHGGPALQVGELAPAKLFEDKAGLEHSLQAAINDWERDSIHPEDIQEYARAMHDKNQQFAQALLSGVGSKSAIRLPPSPMIS